MDKALERAAISVALPEINVRAIREFERPDFIFLVGTHAYIGVEVTELWASQTEARLERIEGYVQKLIDGAPRHPEDAERTRTVYDARITNRHGTHQMIGAGLISDLPNHTQHLDRVAETIEAKTTKYSHYAKPLHGNELVIIDRIGWAVDLSQPLRSSTLLTPRLRTALRLAPFHDVTLLAVADDDRQYRISFRSVQLVERFALTMERAKELVSDTWDSIEGLSILALLTFAEHSPAIPHGFTLNPRAVHFGRFSVHVAGSNEFSLSSTYGDPPGFVVPVWPSQVTEVKGRRLALDILDAVPANSPHVQSVDDITQELRDNILLRRTPDQPRPKN